MLTIDQKIAYFSMEIGIDSNIPTYSGGLGVLAGDFIRSAADMQVPMVGMTLAHRKGYFFQRLDVTGWQQEEPVDWIIDDFMTDTGVRVTVTLEGREVHIRAWKYEVSGYGGYIVPVYFLDTDLPENSAWDRTLTHYLYGSDSHYRLCQEVILGTGGVRILRALGFHDLQRFHMNEGHSSLLTLELLRELLQKDNRSFIDMEPEDKEVVRRQCVFTTHTPVPAGHDQFSLDLVDRVLGNREACGIHDPICHEDQLNMTFLALTLSHYINGVAKKHGEISRHMFSSYNIDSITNGVHAETWVSETFAQLFNHYIPGWRQDNFSLRYALSIPDQEIWKAHQDSKNTLIEYANREMNAGFDRDIFTIGFARRFATYKRADLIFDDLERLRRISRDVGKFQIVFAGKAHPQDQGGKLLIQRIIGMGKTLGDDIPIVYLPHYNMDLARMMTAGVDIWLNTPQPPLEASGTSGMKAALNGVPSLSMLDGWWVEGCLEGVTGWSIREDGEVSQDAGDRVKDADALYTKLEEIILPLYYENRNGFIEIMRHAIALNGSFFNTQRMMQQYVLKAYFPCFPPVQKRGEG
jgi:glycogen phosphorylase